MKHQLSKIATVCILLATNCSTGMTEQTNSFSFLLSKVEDRTVSFKGGGGCAWKDLSYECKACSFLVYQAGVSGESKESTPGVLVNLREGGRELALTCQATQCTLTSILSSGRTESQKLMPHQTGLVVTSADVSITVTK